MRLIHTALTLICAAPLLVAEDALPSQDQLTGNLKQQEAALAELKAKIQGVRDTLAKDESLAPLLKAAQDADAALNKAWQEDADLVAARKAEGEAHQCYAKALDQAVAEDADGKNLLGKISQLDDASWELQVKRTLAQIESEQALRPRIERKDADVTAAGQKLNLARGQYDQRDRNLAEFKAARQRIETAQQAAQKLENTPEIQAARKAVDDLLTAPALTAARVALQEAHAAYETLRRDHPLTKAYEQAAADYTKALEQAVAQNPDGKTLIDRINQIGDDIFERDIQRTLARLEIEHAVKPRMQRKNAEVLAAAQKVNAARVQYEQLDHIAEFKAARQAARQRIDAATQTVQKSSWLENSPEAQAARAALQEANNAYETLRRDHPLTKAFEQASADYTKALEQAVAQNPDGKALTDKINQISDEIFERDIQRTLAHREIEQAVRPRMQRKNAEVLAAAQKSNDARMQYEQRENVAEFKAARQRIEAAQQTAQKLENTPEILAARKVLNDLLTTARQAVQEANTAYEQLRTNHAVTKTLVEADQQYRTLVADKVAASDLGKILATTTNEAGVSLKANQEAREKAQQDINGVRSKMERENQAVLAAAKARQEASEKRQAAERSEAITKLVQARDTAAQAYREALAKAEVDKGLPDLVGKQDATTKQIAATQAILRALDLSSKIKPVTVEAASLESGLVCNAYNTLDAITAKAKPVYTAKVAGVDVDARPADENFTVDYQGFIKLDAKGVYTFALTSDDGSLLYLGDALAIDNGGFHGMVRKDQKVVLEAGYYPIRVVFYQGGGSYGLEFTMAVGEAEAKPVPAAALFAKKADLAALKTVAEVKAAAKPAAK